MTDLQKIENLHAFLAQEGLEVVQIEWGPGYSYPVLYVQPATPPSVEVCGFCGHAEVIHETDAAGKGACLAVDCACEVYCPPVSLEA